MPSHESRIIDGDLVLRSATAEDAEALAEFNAFVFGRPPDPPDLQAAAWTRDLLRGDHPTSSISDHTVVVDRRTNQIVSSCLLISQTWTYGGVAFGVGRPELVGTHPDVRGRGLIGVQIDAIHQRSNLLGHVMQALTGIPYYYRRFGYEPALVLPKSTVLKLPASPKNSGGFRMRPSTPGDLEVIQQLGLTHEARSLVSIVRTTEMWKYELFDRDPASDFWHRMHVIEDASGLPVGIVAVLDKFNRDRAFVSMLEIDPARSWNETAPTVLDLLGGAIDLIENRSVDRVSEVDFDLVPDHPFLTAMSGSAVDVGRAFCWDVRVPDLPAFLRHITPVLEARLAQSELAGFTGELSISFFERGLQFRFDNGRIERIEPWLPDPVWRTELAMPERSFLYLVFGSRTIEDIEFAVPDSRFFSDEGRRLLSVLFPVAPSAFWPVA